MKPIKKYAENSFSVIGRGDAIRKECASRLSLNVKHHDGIGIVTRSVNPVTRQPRLRVRPVA
ncbi:MAG: hypothetical protein J1F68_03155 [Clostridiales bacterium]|nr:hypothetical protein [Clostridiales bacterium]